MANKASKNACTKKNAAVYDPNGDGLLTPHEFAVFALSLLGDEGPTVVDDGAASPLSLFHDLPPGVQDIFVQQAIFLATLLRFPQILKGRVLPERKL